MSFDTFRTTLGGKPAQVIVNGTGIEVQVDGRTGASWKLDKSLTPIEYRATSGNIPAEFKRDEATGELTRCKTMDDGWQPVTPTTDKQLATFSDALAVIDAVSSTPGFPADIKEKLPQAHAALGLPYNAAPHRG